MVAKVFAVVQKTLDTTDQEKRKISQKALSLKKIAMMAVSAMSVSDTVAEIDEPNPSYKGYSLS